MNKRNRRTREQILDYLIGTFNLKENWVKEIDVIYENRYDIYLSRNEILNLRKCLECKLINNESINIRFSIVEEFNNRLFKNLPSINVKLKIINNSFVISEFTIADKFGNHGVRDLGFICDKLNQIKNLISNLETILKLNFRVGKFEKELVNV